MCLSLREPVFINPLLVQAFVGIFLITFFWALILTLRILVVKKRRRAPEEVSKAELQTTPHSRKNPFLVE